MSSRLSLELFDLSSIRAEHHGHESSVQLGPPLHLAERAQILNQAIKDPPAKSAGQIIEDEDTNDTVEKIVAWLEERKLI